MMQLKTDYTVPTFLFSNLKPIIMESAFEIINVAHGFTKKKK
jgi:hypothetical protein